MKIIAIPDVHQTEHWKKVFSTGAYKDYDRVVQLGDWFDNWKNDWTDNKPIKNFKEALDFAEGTRKFDILIGNHDMQYINESFCGGAQYSKRKEIFNALYDAKDKLKVAVMHDGWVFSHAGVSSVWVNNTGCKTVESINELLDISMKYGKIRSTLFPVRREVDQLESLLKRAKVIKLPEYYSHIEFKLDSRDEAFLEEAKKLFFEIFGDNSDDFIKEVIEKNKFLEFNGWNCYGDDPTQGPLWIRPTSLSNNMFFEKQCVGHTEIENGPSITEWENNRLAIVDSRNHDAFLSIDTESGNYNKITL